MYRRLLAATASAVRTTNIYRAIGLRLLSLLLLAAFADACGGSSMKPAGCTAGAETCDCYPNGTCNPGLQCLSNLCVSDGSGGAQGIAGATGSGGSTGAAGSGPGTGGALGGQTGSGGSGPGTGGQAPTNLIKNGDFAQGKTYWDLTYQAGEVAGSDYSGGEYCVANLSSSLYLSFSLGYPPTPTDAFVIQPNTTYTLSYRARLYSGSTQPLVTVKIGHASPPYTDLVSFAGDSIVPSYTTFTHTIFSATGDTGAGLVFNSTLYYLTAVCFDDVILIKN